MIQRYIYTGAVFIGMCLLEALMILADIKTINKEGLMATSSLFLTGLVLLCFFVITALFVCEMLVIYFRVDTSKEERQAKQQKKKAIIAYPHIHDN